MVDERQSVATEERRPWAWEFPAALLLLWGAVIFAIMGPVFLMDWSAWATWPVALVEAVVAAAAFSRSRSSVARALSAAVFLASAIMVFVAAGSLVFGGGPTITSLQ